VLVRIQSKLEAGGSWRSVDGWSFAEFEVLPRVGELVSLQHIAKQGVLLRVDHIVHTPNNVRPTSTTDERPYQAILFVTWLDEDAVIMPSASSDTVVIEEDGACVRAALKDLSGKHTLPAFARSLRRWRQ
jgi:hypothetical protein